jgi:hypothetical protein
VTTAIPRLPYAPLEEYVLARHKPPPDHTYAELGAGGIGEVLGVDATVVRRWKRNGNVRLYDADKIAVTLGQHPSAIWGELWWAA